MHVPSTFSDTLHPKRPRAPAGRPSESALCLHEGLGASLAAIALLLLPGLLDLEIAALVGLVLLFSGGLGIHRAVRLSEEAQTPALTVSSFLATGVGILLLAFRVQGITSLTSLIAAALFSAGVLRSIAALEMRGRAASWWGLALSAAVSLLLFGTVLYAMPQSAAWGLGGLIAVDLLIYGTALVGLGLERAAVTKNWAPRRTETTSASSPAV